MARPTNISRSVVYYYKGEQCQTLNWVFQAGEYQSGIVRGKIYLAYAGTILCRDIDFTGYNRLAGNTSGYFPGKYELAVLAASDGSVFVLSTDPVSARDPENRVQANFAACYLVDGGAGIIFDSLATRWPAVDDTLYPGKPLPSQWVTTVEGGKWQAEYDDIGHFFYFTGFGIFGVEGTMRYKDTTYQVLGVVEHIHARDDPR